MLLQSQSQIARHQTSAHLAQTMSLLELTADELRQKVEQLLSTNPALETVERRSCPHCHRILRNGESCPRCSAPNGHPSEEPIVFVSPRSDFYYTQGVSSNDEVPPEEWQAVVDDLPTFVLRQIASELSPEDRRIAAHILTSLDEDGLLPAPLIEIARYHHVPLAKIEAVQRIIQHAEPIGVGSSTPQAALLVQLEILSENQPVPRYADQAIQMGMDVLSRHAYAELGRLLRLPAREAQSIAEFITSNLNPYPARAHWGDVHFSGAPPRLFQQPDILLSYVPNDPKKQLIVEIVSPYAGALRINPLFRQALTSAPEDKAEEWQADLEAATLLIKCIQQRDHALVRLMQRLTMYQREYILNGDAYLIPLTRARLAGELGVHESTISRAVGGKAVQLPNQRIVPLAKFFDRSLSVRTALNQIIAQETRPLSDTEIAKLLSQQGFFIARRTVAKYRFMEGILPARLRQPAAPPVPRSLPSYS